MPICNSSSVWLSSATQNLLKGRRHAQAAGALDTFGIWLRSTWLGRQVCLSPNTNVSTEKHCVACLAWESRLAGWPVSELGQPIDRTCHTRINCLARADRTAPRNRALQHRTPSKDPTLEDELPREIPGLRKQHCISSSQSAGGTVLGAKVPRNQDAETKLQLFLLTC